MTAARRLGQLDRYCGIQRAHHELRHAAGGPEVYDALAVGTPGGLELRVVIVGKRSKAVSGQIDGVQFQEMRNRQGCQQCAEDARGCRPQQLTPAPLHDCGCLAAGARACGGEVDRAQRKGQVAGRVEAAVGLLLQTMGHDLAQRRHDVFRQLRRIVAQNRSHHFDAGLAFEGRAPCQAFVQHHAETEDIAALVHRLAAHLFGRHVPGRSQDGARGGAGERLAGIAFAGHLLGEAEIQDLGAPVMGEHDVLGLEVAVDDGSGVSGGQPIGHLPGEFQHPGLRQRAAPHDLAQRVSLDQFADDVTRSSWLPVS